LVFLIKVDITRSFLHKYFSWSWSLMYWYLRGTLDKGSRSKVQWNWTFLLVKSFRLVSKPIDKDPRPRQIKLWFSLHGIILEGKLIEIDKKKSFKERSWFGEPKCKLGSKVPFFLMLFFIFVAQILWKWKKYYVLRTLLRAPKLPHFWPILELTWLV